MVPNGLGLIKPGQERLKPVTKQKRFNQQRQRLVNDLIGFLPNQLAKIIGRQSDVVICVQFEVEIAGNAGEVFESSLRSVQFPLKLERVMRCGWVSHACL